MQNIMCKYKRYNHAKVEFSILYYNCVVIRHTSPHIQVYVESSGLKSHFVSLPPPVERHRYKCTGLYVHIHQLTLLKFIDR